MAKKRNGSLRKIAALFILIFIAATLLLSLSSCTSSEKIAPKDEDESIEKYAAKVIATNSTEMTHFIAASRGHDMKAEDFDDDKADGISDPDVEAAKAALEAAIKSAKFKNSEESKEILNSFKEDLDAEQVLLVAEKLKVECDHENDPGFFDYILIGVGKALGWLTKIMGQQYVLSIMVFALVVEILMLPVSIKQQKNSIGMAKLRPKMMKIEKKYAGRTDQATLRKKQEEIMELQKNEGYSPFSGCLPLLLQLVIVGFILYPIIQNPLHYMLDKSEDFSQVLMSYVTSPKAVGGLAMSLSSKGNVIEVLSILDNGAIEGIKDFALISNGEAMYDVFINLPIPNFEIFGINFGKVPKILDILVIIPILNVLVQWVSMKLTRKWMGNANPAAAAGGDNSQMNASMKIMDWMMPLMTVFILFQTPALIGVYWIFRSGVSLLKQYIIKRVLPVPKYTEEELKEMEKAEKERQKAEKAIIKTQPKYRSLHYIDEEDYDELPEIKSSEKKDTGKAINSDKPEIKD